MTKKSRKTKIGEPKPAFTAIIKECELAMSFSYAIETVDDGEGNPVKFVLWMSGDWKVEYKGKEYLIPVSENVTALVNWINSQEK